MHTLTTTVLIFGFVAYSYGSQADAKRNYRFDGTIARKVLENYLARAITMMDLCTGHGNVDDNIRMLKNIGAKFAGRTLYVWGGEKQLTSRARAARGIAEKIHKVDPDMILQGCVFEIVTTEVNEIGIPEYVFKDFDLPVDKRNFRYDSMLFDNGKFHNHWSTGASVPDMTKLETRMWFYYVATLCIDSGMEAIHFGQISLVGADDKDWAGWRDMLARVRRYAAVHARRHLVLCDAHTPDGGPIFNGELLLDSHAFPLRIKEDTEPEKGLLEVGYLDTLFGRSRGGISPQGWKCEHLPYLVEFDNWGSSGKPGKGGMPYWTWGYDEICWFAHQPETYRNEWLNYAWNWVRKNDPNGYLEMPGSRCLADPVNGNPWYEANTRTSACPSGYSQEETIKSIWARDGK